MNLKDFPQDALVDGENGKVWKIVDLMTGEEEIIVRLKPYVEAED
jgi:hypothetical protein